MRDRHLRVNIEEKPFACGFCVKRFRNEKSLKVHENVHTGVKPYPCPECKASFTLKSNMTRHLKMKHRDEDTVDELENVAVPVGPSLRNRTFIVTNRNQDAPHRLHAL